MSAPEDYQELLKHQIREAGWWLIVNAEKMVNDIPLITDYQINVNLRNGEELPSITTSQENFFWDYKKYYGGD